jgi:hypothetical protein
MNAQESETATLRGATWSALDKIMISPLVSKVKRAYSPDSFKTVASSDHAHTSPPVLPQLEMERAFVR